MLTLAPDAARRRTEIRSYVFEALMALVSLHGKIAPTARQFMPLYAGPPF